MLLTNIHPYSFLYPSCAGTTVTFSEKITTLAGISSIVFHRAPLRTTRWASQSFTLYLLVYMSNVFDLLFLRWSFYQLCYTALGKGHLFFLFLPSTCPTSLPQRRCSTYAVTKFNNCNIILLGVWLFVLWLYDRVDYLFKTTQRQFGFDTSTCEQK